MKQNSQNIFEKISEICRDFRKQISRSKLPRIEEFLTGISDAGQENLFSNLLEIEINFRQRKGESPSTEEYLSRFPQFAKQVRRAFFEPTLASVDSASSVDGATRSLADAAASAADVPTFDIPDANRLGDYELIREVGRGGMGVVYEARHTKTGNVVALKTLPTGGRGQEVNADKLHRFRKEFRRLSEINHPNLVGMQTLEVDGNQWFFTMDLVGGEDFLSFVRPNNELDEERLRSCLIQLAQGVMALHRQRIIHRDLKPSNVLVSHDGTVSILDFGLAAEMQRTSDMTQTKSGMFAGTPRYAAPEQMFGERTEASDWYALGTMVYESLTGEPPFTAKNQIELLRQKQNDEAPSLSEQDGLPEDLALLADGLIRRVPAERLSSPSIAERLQFDQETHAGGSTAGSLGSTGSVGEKEPDQDDFFEEEVVLIGRETQLAQLEESRQELLKTQTPVVVWITGLSGEGKSSLAEKFLRPLRKGTEMLVLSGRCYDRESVPFKAIDSIIDPLVRYLRSLSDRDIERILPGDIEMLAQLFPLLKRVRAITGRMSQQILTLDSKQIRYRAFEALRELLVSIGEINPIALMIDDLQWGDADSALALYPLLFGDDPPAVLFLGTYRRDEMDESSFYRQWSQTNEEKEIPTIQREISVKPLDQEQCIALATARVGMTEDAAREVVARLFENTQGNPYLMEQLIEGFNAGATDWQPLPLRDIIAKKFERLPQGSESLLNDVAIAGKAIQANELSEVSGLGSGVLSLLTHMRSERLVRLVGSGEGQLVDTWHDKIRETMLERLDPATREAMHLKFGESIESSEGLSASAVESYLSQSFTTQAVPEFSTEKVYDLAYHFHLAGDRRALCYQFLAGELAFQTYATEEAIEYLVRASGLLQGDEPARWNARLWHRLATSSYRIIDFDKAIKQSETGIKFAEPGLERAIFFAGMAKVYQTRSAYDSAIQCHDLALAEIKRKRPKGLLAYPATAFKLVKLLLWPELWLCRKTDETTEEAKLELSIYLDLLAYIFEMYFSIIEYPSLVMRLGVLAHRADAAGFASGVGLAAAHLGISGFPRLGQRLARRAIARIGEKTNAEIEGICRFGAAISLTYSVDFQEAEQEFRNSIPLLVKSGSHAQAGLSWHLLHNLQESVSSASAEVDSARKLIELTRNSGDLRSLCWGQYDLAAGLARHGKIGESISAIDQARKTWGKCKLNLTTSIFFSQRSFVFLQASAVDLACELSDYSWRFAYKNLNLMDPCLRGLAWYLECIAGPHWSTNPLEFDHRLIRQRCRWARLLAVFYVKIRPHLLRSTGRAFTALGKTRKGIHNFELAVNSAKKLGMKYDLAKSLLDLAAVKEEDRDENRAEAIRLLKEMESVIPRAESWLLGDQYDESVVAPEFDLDAWERENGSVTA